jgi:putative lipoprotein
MLLRNRNCFQKFYTSTLLLFMLSLVSWAQIASGEGLENSSKDRPPLSRGKPLVSVRNESSPRHSFGGLQKRFFQNDTRGRAVLPGRRASATSVVRKQSILRTPNVLQKSGPKDPWFGSDKVQHFFASAVLTSFGFFIMREPLDSSENNALYFGSGFSLSFGVGKEIYDWKSKKGNASYKDLVADILGIGFAVLIFKLT